MLSGGKPASRVALATTARAEGDSRRGGCMNSGSSFAVLALASIDSATSKVLASNWRLVTWTLSESCGWVCSIRLCGARGFSKLRSLMYWPCMMSGPAGAWAGPGGGDGGGVVVMAYFRCFGGGGTMQGCTAQGAGRRRGRQLPRHRLETMIAAPL